ncbi:unnamed protein product [Leptidea sinapis]|uniref:Methyltransferase-like protein 22 n=1 Tax=Leptidea sinapis TaxID=189913 RepID=A0A5E4QYF6_9NEOP|nr:unnamed protein product [Leptidea sinapis]
MPDNMTVVSEIYDEHNYRTDLKPKKQGNVISQFPFLVPKGKNIVSFDSDNDLDLDRPNKEVIKIEHSLNTKLSLVGLQVWRGAFLLGDLLIHLGVNGELDGKTVLELGAGTGLTSFVASIYAKKVVCTDIDLGGILDLIKLNAKYNDKLIKSQFKVVALDFMDTNWNSVLQREVQQADIIVAADVIYDDDVTTAFMTTVHKILTTNPPKTLYIVLEKRYVFTLEHMDSVAPCYETFLNLLEKLKLEKMWVVEELSPDFPQYFQYERVSQLVLWKISASK